MKRNVEAVNFVLLQARVRATRDLAVEKCLVVVQVLIMVLRTLLMTSVASPLVLCGKERMRAMLNSWNPIVHLWGINTVASCLINPE